MRFLFCTKEEEQNGENSHGHNSFLHASLSLELNEELKRLGKDYTDGVLKRIEPLPRPLMITKYISMMFGFVFVIMLITWLSNLLSGENNETSFELLVFLLVSMAGAAVYAVLLAVEKNNEASACQ